MTDPVLRNGEVFTTIFSFSDALNRQSGINEADYRQLLATQSITASDSLGRGESNDGTIASALPVYFSRFLRRVIIPSQCRSCQAMTIETLTLIFGNKVMSL